jgi:hypothetical protein
VTRAAIAMFALAENAPDRRTSLADLRIALCLEIGVAIEDIAPASGHNISRRSYENIRAQWQEVMARDPDSEWCRRSYDQVRRSWLRHQPEWTDDWLATPSRAEQPAVRAGTPAGATAAGAGQMEPTRFEGGPHGG